MTTFKFRALITLGPAAHDSQGHDYPSGTRAVMVRASSLAMPAHRKYFEAVIERDDAPSLHHGDREIVTIAVTDSHAGEFFAPGQHFTLWNGHDNGTGVVSRQVYTTGSPS
jgi:hypothetical protein